jgi:hypothetical protein
MNEYRNNKLDPPLLQSAPEILSLFENGEIGLINGKKIFQEDIFEISQDLLKTDHPDVKINTHKSLLNNDPVIHKQPLGEFLDNLDQFKSGEINRSYERIWSIEKFELYGVVNCRHFRKKGTLKFDFKKEFRHAISLLWVGMSPGGMHFDPYDNVLTQIRGSKRVVIFPARVSDDMATTHDIKFQEMRDAFSDVNIKDYPWLNKLPYYEVVLHPGDALIIPSGAYHAPMATSIDSISLNAFLTNKWMGHTSSKYARKTTSRPWVVDNMEISINQLLFRLFKFHFAQNRLYEIL